MFAKRVPYTFELDLDGLERVEGYIRRRGLQVIGCQQDWVTGLWVLCVLCSARDATWIRVQ